MSTSRWQTVIARVTRNDPEDLDDILRLHDDRADDPGADIFPEGIGMIPFTSEFREVDAIAIGVRIRQLPPDPAGLAVQLATFALERNVEVIVMSHLDYSSLERFGFRTERISGRSEAARLACENQVAAFWNLGVII